MARTEDAKVRITHPERVIYPEKGITKQQVADYYAAVMDAFLPGVTGRPTSVLRCPEGRGSACFFQKHEIAGLKRVATVPMEEVSGARDEYLCPDSPDAVLELVQFGSLEFHPWGALARDPGHATFVVFDLDPGPNVTWTDVVAGARAVRKVLAGMGLMSFVRLTGGKGVHVVAPLCPPCPWDAVKPFAQGIARSLAAQWPDRFVAVASKRERAGMIFIDYLRNSRGATSVASYSLRAREGAPVAMPLRWDELGRAGAASAFDMSKSMRRLARQRSHPWEGWDDVRQGLPPIA
ncbi:MULTISPECIES: non-homologous end-joining DNA ligase [Dyella]|uniref:DNA polymerase domain-containing protein n=2 Tax=Dyella TaxID=231454 RepID=A0A4V2NMD7_9GAMM|nr:MULTISPECIES: non-homologous end-joining DNA ligase [Dyella]TBR39498.1 DNA polymerase domain-containing protein [Dyella terrae]TCI12917.1 DNA polymerase domain-containing protein [Dyella soli]